MKYKTILALNIKRSVGSIFFVITTISLLLLVALTLCGYTLFDIRIDLSTAVKSIHSITVTVIPFYVLVFCAHYFGGNSGKTILMRCSAAHSHEIIAIKFIEMLIYLTVTLGAIHFTAWAGVLLYDKSLVTKFIQSKDYDLPGTLFIQSLVTIVPVTTFAIFWASLLKSEMTALGASLGSYLILDLVKNYFDFSKYFFSAYYDIPFQRAYDALNDIQGFYQYSSLYASSCVWTALLLLAASLVFRIQQ